ncbi:MAG: S8 family serine peptidase [Thaumarchaeota archaeon]|nr:S8 family serine peptidase [Nitrososphaerota archaeon]
MVSERSFEGDNTFLQTKSTPKENRVIKTFHPMEKTEIDFEAINEDEEFQDIPLIEQIKSTVSALSEKTVKSDDEVFYIIHPKVPPSDYGIEQVLERLDAEIVDYLDAKHTTFIVRGSNARLSKLTKKDTLPQILSGNIHVIRPVLDIDQISPDAEKELQKENRISVIALMPNVAKEYNEKHAELLKNFFVENNFKTYSEFSEEGLFFTDADLSKIHEFLKKSTFVHFVEPVPLAFAQELKNAKDKQRGSSKVMVSGMEPLTKSVDLPLVAVLDSGVNMIEPLKNIIENQDSYNYATVNDISGDNGHGTAVATLLSLGENLGTPKTRIISYKIFEKPDDEKTFSGMIEGIKKFRNDTRLFLSSVNFGDLNPKLEAKLDKLVQRENLCFVNSIGNILPDKIEEGIRKSGYPAYISDHKIQFPSSAVSVIGVGSIASKKYPEGNAIRSIAEIGQMAPYTRCKSDNVFLFECYKPEVVESGANVNLLNNKINTDEVGISSYNKDGKLMNFFGTSFSAPLFMRKIAELEQYYGTSITNVETLKALAYLSCKPLSSTCSGLGHPRRIIGCDNDHTVYYVEGTIKLRGEETKQYYENPYSEFTIKVPSSTGRIDLCLVHSDDFQLSNFPALNTYLRVDAWKTASESKVEVKNPLENDKATNVKRLSYWFTKWNMEGKWTFKIYPELTTKIASRYRKDVKIRYGAAILLSRRPTHKKSMSMNQEIQAM